MVVSKNLTILLLSSLLVALVDADLKLFEKYREQVFGNGDDWLNFRDVRAKIELMIQLIEAGKVPIGAQSEHSLDYLRSLIDDCTVRDHCNTEVLIGKRDRLGRHRTQAPNLNLYLNTCRSQVLRQCADTIHEQVNNKLGRLDEQSYDIVKKVAIQVNHFFRVKEIHQESNMNEDLSYSLAILKTVEKLRNSDKDNDGGEDEDSIKKTLDKIRSSCVSFLAYIDPIVEQYPNLCMGSATLSPIQELMNWHFYQKHCKNIANRWDSLLARDLSNYEIYLLDPEPIKAGSNKISIDHKRFKFLNYNIFGG